MDISYISNDLHNLLGSSYTQIANQARRSRSNLINDLFSQRKLPAKGWDSLTIQLCLDELAGFDSNNYINSAGVGEREGRIYSDLVAKRYFGLAHGIGRSGDLMASQPKAIGSTLMNLLAERLAQHALKICGLKSIQSCIVVPMATGMSLTFCLLTFKKWRPNAKYVLWPRIDQKSCFKSIIAANLTPLVLPMMILGDALVTDTELLTQYLFKYGFDNIVCIMSTTSTFAPRLPDNIIEIATICKKWNIPHLVNNAYGLHCNKCSHLIDVGCRIGRVDAIVSSLDKNFMVPVSGSIISSPFTSVVEQISHHYPGRASGSSAIDLYITLLQMGIDGLTKLRNDRITNANWFYNELKLIAQKFGTRMLDTFPKNSISFAISLEPFKLPNWDNADKLKCIGSMLFTRRCFGCRVVLSDTETAEVQSAKIADMDGFIFKNYGAHSDNYPLSYLTAACSIGASYVEMKRFLDCLTECLTHLRKLNSKILDLSSTET